MPISTRSRLVKKASAGGDPELAFSIEWPTLWLMALCYGLWAVAVFWLGDFAPWLAVLLLMPVLALHSSLQHEVIHGHPTGIARLNEAMVFPALGLLIPFGRFRDTHLAHHINPNLTDPYEDPETNYVDQVIWNRWPRWMRRLLQVNNTLLGRLVLGPAIGLVRLLRDDARLGGGAVARAWGLHLVGSGLVLGALWAVGFSVWHYLIAAYGALSVLRIRTFLEHQAHELQRARSVIIEDRGLLALLFLNNNFHAVHHARPGLAWYRLPGAFMRNRARYLRLNQGYYYRSYGEVFRRHLLRAKDPVPHPLWTWANRRRR